MTYLAASGDLATAPIRRQVANDISVGGTVLAKSGSHYSETVWRDTSGACAPNIAKPAWEHDPGCSQRTANDIAGLVQRSGVRQLFVRRLGSRRGDERGDAATRQRLCARW